MASLCVSAVRRLRFSGFVRPLMHSALSTSLAHIAGMIEMMEEASVKSSSNWSEVGGTCLLDSKSFLNKAFLYLSRSAKIVCEKSAERSMVN